MKKLFKEILEELLMILKGRTIDAILPPIIYFIVNRYVDLLTALIIAVSFALVLFIRNRIKHEKSFYAVIGLSGVVVAAVFAYLSDNPSTYFLPDLLTNVLVILLAIYSLMVDRPMAAYASNITRGWPIAWFWRDDVKPAYREVTWLWLGFFTARAVLELWIYLLGSLASLVFVNIVLGLPLLIFILTISYIYGIWRLRRLGGPGVDEFIDGKEPPFRGQTRGF
jgi:hypothetical protein